MTNISPEFRACKELPGETLSQFSRVAQGRRRAIQAPGHSFELVEENRREIGRSRGQEVDVATLCRSRGWSEPLNWQTGWAQFPGKEPQVKRNPYSRKFQRMAVERLRRFVKA
jgi:hypothetical protein